MCRALRSQVSVSPGRGLGGQAQKSLREGVDSTYSPALCDSGLPCGRCDVSHRGRPRPQGNRAQQDREQM